MSNQNPGPVSSQKLSSANSSPQGKLSKLVVEDQVRKVEAQVKQASESEAGAVKSEDDEASVNILSTLPSQYREKR